MLNEHAKLGIAAIVFYVPAVTVSAYLLFHRHRRPRMAWYFLFIFSLVRLTSGVVVILYEGKPNEVGLLIAAIILLGVGVMPLIAVIIGMLRIILAKDFDEDRLYFKAVILSRCLFFAGVVQLVIGGLYVGQYKKPNAVSLGVKLVRAGYIVVVVLLAFLIGFQAQLWFRRGNLSHVSRIVLKGTNLATPFLVIRITYAMLSVFETADIKWNNLSGSVSIFVIMCLAMEYAAVSCFVVTGLLIPRIAPDKKLASETRRVGSEQRGTPQSEDTIFKKLRTKWDGRD